MLIGLSILFGFSIAAPVVSVMLSRQSLSEHAVVNLGSTRRFFLGSLFIFSATTHIGVFALAAAATWAPGLFTTEAARALHINHSLLGMIEVTQRGLSSAHIRDARLRQINEMTGTSSLFLFKAGLLCNSMQQRNMVVTKELVLWMFLTSLVAGPGAGAAAVLLLRDSIVKGTIIGKMVRHPKM